jgi:hypothetical protein
MRVEFNSTLVPTCLSVGAPRDRVTLKFMLSLSFLTALPAKVEPSLPKVRTLSHIATVMIRA